MNVKFKENLNFRHITSPPKWFIFDPDVLAKRSGNKLNLLFQIILFLILLIALFYFNSLIQSSHFQHHWFFEFTDSISNPYTYIIYFFLVWFISFYLFSVLLNFLFFNFFSIFYLYLLLNKRSAFSDRINYSIYSDLYLK